MLLLNHFQSFLYFRQYRFAASTALCIVYLSARFALSQSADIGTNKLATARETLRSITADLKQNNDLRRVTKAEEWTQMRPKLQQELREMLGLDPLPERTPLQPVVTGMIEQTDVVVERIHFQSSPGLYVTGNLYRPPKVEQPLPAVLYVCGHGQVVENGVSMGNKTYYQHHGIWFATHGYICLVIDTIQLGEIEGIHHGTHRMNRWDWPAKGYTPAGVEAWNSIRAIDYLVSRPDVDALRIGITGRSGGGAYSWFTAALDDRIAVVIPVAGITDMQNHVVDNCIAGHCDCMYMVNLYRWDFPVLAALIAPRPLLIGNTDRDKIFPLDGVVRVHEQVAHIYKLLGAEDKVGIQWTSGGHEDTQELQLGCFVWMDRFLQGSRKTIIDAASKRFEPKKLRVFKDNPSDQRVTTVQDWFSSFDRDKLLIIEQARPRPVEAYRRDLALVIRGRRSVLHEIGDKKILDPLSDQAPKIELTVESKDLAPNTRRLYAESRDKLFPFEIWEFQPRAFSNIGSIRVVLPDAQQSEDSKRIIADESKFQWNALEAALGLSPDANSAIAVIVQKLPGPGDWGTIDNSTATQLRRAFLLTGRSLEGQQVESVLAAFQNQELFRRSNSLKLFAKGPAAAIALHVAAISERKIDSLELKSLDKEYGKDFSVPGISQKMDLQKVLSIVGAGSKVVFAE